MKLLEAAFLIGVASAGSACATPARQTEAFLKAPREIPVVHELREVPFVEQSANHCGPATLTMAMNHAGHPVGVDELSAQMYTPGKQGTLQADMLTASRRQGMLVVPVHGIQGLLEEIAAGNPVVVLVNQALKWYPRWHYALAIGYDLNEVELLIHSGPHAFRRAKLRNFERAWALSDYWGVVVLPPTKLSATGDELSHAAGAAALEKLGNAVAAEQVYLNILKRWPGSLSALLGMGNLRYSAKKYPDSVNYLKEATRYHPLSAMVWHNLAFAQGAAGMRDSARKSAEKALALVAPASLGTYRESLKEYLGP